MRTDTQIEKDVTHLLRQSSDRKMGNISANVQRGIVTLRGTVVQFFEKTAAEKIAWQVGGVRAIIDEIEVKPPRAYEKSNAELALAALKALADKLSAPQEFRLTIDEGWITLGGQTNWDTERLTAESILSSLTGVKGVSSTVAIIMKERRSAVRTGFEIRDW